MALFNKTRNAPVPVMNRAGGMAYARDPKMALATILLTSFAQGQTYRCSRETFDELRVLIPKADPLFAAKAAVYARSEFRMRSITHVLAAELATFASGKAWARDFYRSIVLRPDDMTEIAAYMYNVKGMKLTNAMKSGFAQAFDRFDGYQIAKYRSVKKEVKLLDIANLVHPVPTERNREALKALIDGSLRAKSTWESALTEAGQDATSEREKRANKREAWKKLIKGNRLGYFALLRNLRNIAMQSPAMMDISLRQLTDPVAISKSKVLPFRFLKAHNEIERCDLPAGRKILAKLDIAIELATRNVPVFGGKTLVVLDDSGSMTWKHGKSTSPIQTGALFAAALFRRNDADLMTFSETARYRDFYFNDSVSSITNRLISSAVSGGTNFHAIFTTARRGYDRIFILSDMQGWMGEGSPQADFMEYRRRTGSDPFVYAIDLQGYGSMQLVRPKVFDLAGFSEKVFDLVKILEQDKRALIRKIEATPLGN